MKIEVKEQFIEHPLEELFDIEPCTTVAEYKEVTMEPIVEMPNYDAKDKEIEQKLEDIYAVAMGQAQIIGDEIEQVEGKYKARMGEVTATMLNVALSAVREKSQLKQHKDKNTVAIAHAGTPNTVNNNLIVGTRNEILKALKDKKAQSSE